MPALNAGITPPGQGDRNTVWNILGQTYYLKEVCDTSFAFEVVGEPGTFVPAHIHPTQDEFIYLMEGEGCIRLDDRDYDVEKGAGIYLGPSEMATIQAANGVTLKLFHHVIPQIPK